jgi:hypothetical protein
MRQRHLEHPQILLGGEELARRRLHARRDDHLRELLADLLGRGAVQRTVEGEDAAESRGRIGRERLAVGSERPVGHRHAAGIGVLDDHAGRLGEALDALPGRVRIGDVVVGKLLALQCDKAGDAAGHRFAITVEGRRLVRILAVAHLPGA